MAMPSHIITCLQGCLEVPHCTINIPPSLQYKAKGGVGICMARVCAVGTMWQAHVVPCPTMLCYVVNCHPNDMMVMLCDVVSYGVLCNVMLWCVVPCHSMVCCAMSCYAVLCHIML